MFGHPLLVIQWMKGDFTLRNFTMQPLFLDNKNMQLVFIHVPFAHVYKDKKRRRLSKERLVLQEGTWEFLESTQGQFSSYFHEP
jgi:hypothetical protein